MTTEILTITPDLAKGILANNKGNRKLNDNHVNFLTGQMLAGKWLFTGDPIKISHEKRLLDGQHRLQAVVKSGKSQDFLIAKDLDDEIFNVLDTGKVRTAADVLSTQSIKNPNESAAIAKFVILYRAGKLQHKGKVSNE